MSALARELGVVVPVSFWERSNNGYYNSLAMIDADGANLGVYRKSHIPDSPGYVVIPSVTASADLCPDRWITLCYSDGHSTV